MQAGLNLRGLGVQKFQNRINRLIYQVPRMFDSADFYSILIYRVLTEAELQKRHEEARERHAARLAGTQEAEQSDKEGKV